MKTAIRRWGNSSAVRIPGQILTQAGLQEGANVEITSTETGVITLRAIRVRESIEELFAAYDGEQLFSEELSWGEPQGDEIW